MKAQETKLKFMLEGKRQYAVPLYQRRYAWKQRDWQTFWAAVKRQYDLVVQGGEALTRPTHFFGSLVVHPTSELASGLSGFNIIDGQQRLTTVISLLTAIRDLWDDEESKERVHETYLVNKWEKGEGRYKLLPGPHDRGDIKALVDGKPENAVGSIGSAYRWMRNQLELLGAKNGGVDFDALERTVITRLEVIDVTADANDNAHRIFQTLNSTGRALTQVDLLRNHFFMLLPSKADEAYENHWSPIETTLGSWMDLYLWVETVSRGGGREVVPRDRVYAQWQEDLAAIEYDEEAVYREVQELAKKATAYAQIVFPDRVEEKGLRLRLQRLRDWGTNVYHPVALQAMVLWNEGKLSDNDVAEALLYMESFMVRRMLVGIPTNNLNRIFTTTAGQIKSKKRFPEALRRALSSAGKKWPSDVEVLAGISTEPFYKAQRGSQRQFILRRLEEGMPGKEKPDWDAAPYTLEHVMPQNLNQAWLKVLSDSGEADPVTAHQELVHVLGNITLTTENSVLSDHPLQRKQEILKTSVLKLNRQIEETEGWDRDIINSRGKDFAELARQLWPGPIAAGDLEDSTDLATSLTGILQFLPDGGWVSLDDLAEFAEVASDDVRSFLIANDIPGRERVLNADGTLDVSLPWVASDLAGYKSGLVATGVLDDTTATVAAAGQRVTMDSLASLANGS